MVYGYVISYLIAAILYAALIQCEIDFFAHIQSTSLIKPRVYSYTVKSVYTIHLWHPCVLYCDDGIAHDVLIIQGQWRV